MNSLLISQKYSLYGRPKRPFAHFNIQLILTLVPPKITIEQDTLCDPSLTWLRHCLIFHACYWLTTVNSLSSVGFHDIPRFLFHIWKLHISTYIHLKHACYGGSLVLQLRKYNIYNDKCMRCCFIDSQCASHAVQDFTIDDLQVTYSNGNVYDCLTFLQATKPWDLLAFVDVILPGK